MNSRGIWRLKHVFPLYRQKHQTCVLTLKVNQSILKCFGSSGFPRTRTYIQVLKYDPELARNYPKELPKGINNIYSNNYFSSVLKTDLTTGKYQQNFNSGIKTLLRDSLTARDRHDPRSNRTCLFFSGITNYGLNSDNRKLGFLGLFELMRWRKPFDTSSVYNRVLTWNDKHENRKEWT